MANSSLLFASVLCFLIVSLCVNGEAPLLRKNVKDRIKGSYIVVLNDDVDVDTFALKLEQLRRTPDEHIFHRYKHVFKGFAARLTPFTVKKLLGISEVAYIEEDGIARANAPVWGLDRVDQRYLPLDGGASFSGNGVGIHAYVVDTGININHYDFGGRATLDYPTSGVTADDNGHGTHCAGTLGGQTYGVAKSVMIHSVKVLDRSGEGSWSGVTAGLDWIRANGEKPAVVSMSLGGGGSTSMDNAVKSLDSSGFVVVVAAGNDYANACYYSPARVSEAITVGATDSNDRIASFSNTGNCVDIFAPGVSIESASHTSNSGSTSLQGTSMACPHVAGGVAILLGEGKSASQAKATILSDATSNEIRGSLSGASNLLLYVP